MEIYRILNARVTVALLHRLDGAALFLAPQLPDPVARPRWRIHVVENPCREDALLRKEVFWTVVQFHIKSSLKSQKRVLCTLKVGIYSLSKIIIICCRVCFIRCVSGCDKSHFGLCGLCFLSTLLCSLFLLHLLV